MKDKTTWRNRIWIALPDASRFCTHLEWKGKKRITVRITLFSDLRLFWLQFIVLLFIDCCISSEWMQAMDITWHADYRLNSARKKTVFAFSASASSPNPKPGTLEKFHPYNHNIHAKQTRTLLPATEMLAATCFPSSFSQSHRQRWLSLQRSLYSFCYIYSSRYIPISNSGKRLVR